MQFLCSQEYTKELNTVVDFVKDDDIHSACVFVGSKSRSHTLLEKLEKKLNAALLTIDVIHVHGSLSKEEKYWLIRIYCARIDVAQLCSRILLATSAANIGIDHNLAKLVLNMGWPRDLCTYFQQRGRVGRDALMAAICIQLGSLSSYVGIMFQIYMSTDDAALDEDAEALDAALVGINSAVSPTPKQKRNNTSKNSYKATACAKRQQTLRSRSELLDVIKFFCLECKCQHVLGEWFMSHGKLETPTSDIERCGDKCPVCRGDWHKTFLKVDKVKVIRFLECDSFQKQMGTLVASGDNVVDILWRDEKWRMKDIFRCNVKKSHVDALFLQLIAKKIIELRHTSNGLVWVLGRVQDPSTTETRETILNYKQKNNWVGLRIF